MITCLSISNFLTRVRSLLDVKKGVYKGVTAEIENAFNGKDIDEIRQNRDMILQQDSWKIIKLRLQDKKQHLSKRDGYRLIYLVSMTEEKIILLDIYPKNGPSQQLDIEDSEIFRLLKEFISEQEANTLSQFP